MAGKRISLDGDWHFRTDVDDIGIREQWYRRPLASEDCWKTLRVPGFWEQHGRDGYEGVGWYRRDFHLPASKHSKQLGICLGGLGIHRFYLGYPGIGMLQILVSMMGCSCVVIGCFPFPVPLGALWGFVEGILCLTGSMTDADGRELED